MDTYYRIGQPFGVAPLLGDWQEWECEAERECGLREGVVKEKVGTDWLEESNGKD